MKVCVVGGANADIIGTPDNMPVLRDSNPGRVDMRPGGVGRNIAENLARMGFFTELIAPFGEDAFSAFLRESCEKSGIRTGHSVTLPGMSCGIYLCLNDGAGDMYLAINDMRICSMLTPERVDMKLVNSMDACVLDANISRETLAYIAENARVPLVADPVSLSKCKRLSPILPALSLIKPNIMEARRLTGRQDPVQCACALVDMGVKRAFVSLGAQGIAYADQVVSGIQPAGRPNIVNTTGAGDSATAALTAALITGLDTPRAAQLAAKVAMLTLSCDGAVSEKLTPDILNQ